MAPVSMRDLAQRLLAAEAASDTTSLMSADEGVRVCEKLRIALTRFAGAEGFNSLLRRALVLARTEVPALQSVQVAPNGSLEGLEKLATDPNLAGADAAAAVTKHLLGLLVTFLGKPITLRLVHEAWPDASLEA